MSLDFSSFSLEYLTAFIAAVVVFLGLYAIITRKNLVKILIGLEIMSKGVTLNFLANSSSVGESMVILIIGVEVIVTAIAMAIIINVYRMHGTLDAGKVSKLRG